jgi:heme exporter protein C
VFAITAGAFVPLNFIAVRLAESLVHPRVLGTAEGGMPGEMWFTFAVCMAGIALLWVSLLKFELVAKDTSAELSRLRVALESRPAETPPPEPRPQASVGAG